MLVSYHDIVKVLLVIQIKLYGLYYCFLIKLNLLKNILLIFKNHFRYQFKVSIDQSLPLKSVSYLGKPFQFKVKKNKTGFCRFGSSSLPKKPNILKSSILFMSTIDDSSYFSDKIIFEEMSSEKLRDTLDNMKIISLRKLAKDYNINLRSQRKKSKIISLIIDYFLELKTANSTDNVEVLANGFDKIIMDSNKNINISAWFRGTNIRLIRCLNSERFNALLKSVCKIENKKSDEVMYKDKHGDVYVTLVLALHAATYLNTKLHYNILKHYIETKPKQQAEEIEMLRNKLLLAEQSITTSNTLKWVNFQISYAFYIIVIDNIAREEPFIGK